jgi:hypothetical protein
MKAWQDEAERAYCADHGMHAVRRRWFALLVAIVVRLHRWHRMSDTEVAERMR